MNQKGFVKDVVIIVLAILLLGGGYFYFSKKPAYAPVENTTQNQIADETKDWKTYENKDLGMRFRYPKEWKINDGKNKISGTEIFDLEILVSNIDSYGLGNENEEFRKSTEDGTAPNIISFQGGKGSLGVGCADLGGRPSPHYTFVLFVGDKDILLSAVDLGVRLDSKMCKNDSEYSYLNEINTPYKMSEGRYKVYNDFITLINKTLVVKK